MTQGAFFAVRLAQVYRVGPVDGQHLGHSLVGDLQVGYRGCPCLCFYFSTLRNVPSIGILHNVLA